MIKSPIILLIPNETLNTWFYLPRIFYRSTFCIRNKWIYLDRKISHLHDYLMIRLIFDNNILVHLILNDCCLFVLFLFQLNYKTIYVSNVAQPLRNKDKSNNNFYTINQTKTMWTRCFNNCKLIKYLSLWMGKSCKSRSCGLRKCDRLLLRRGRQTPLTYTVSSERLSSLHYTAVFYIIVMTIQLTHIA